MSQDQQEIFVRQTVDELKHAIKKKDKHIIEENLRQKYCKDNNLEYVPQKERRRQDKQQVQQSNRNNQNNNQQQQQSRKKLQQVNEQNQMRNNEANNFMQLYSQHTMKKSNTQQKNNRQTQSRQSIHYKKNRNTKRIEKHIKIAWPNHQKQFGSRNKKSKFNNYDFNNFDDDYQFMQNEQQNNQYVDKRDKKRELNDDFNQNRNNNNRNNYQGEGRYIQNNNKGQNNDRNYKRENNNNNQQENYRQNNQERNNREERTRETGNRNRGNGNNRDDRNNQYHTDGRYQNDRNNRNNNNNYRRKYDDEFGLAEYEDIDRQERSQNYKYQQKKRTWKKDKNIYEQYYTQEEIEKGKQENQIFEGIFLGNEFSIQMGNVKCPIFSKKVQINSQIDINRALHGALVAFKIIKVTKLEEDESEETEEEIQVKLPEIKQQVVQDKEVIIVEDDHDEDWEDLNSDESEESEESEEEQLYVEKKKEPLTTIQQLQKSKLVGKIVAVLKNPYENRQLVGKIELREINKSRTYSGQNKEDFIKFLQNNFYLSFKSVNKRLPYFNMKSIQLFNFEYSEEPLEKFLKYVKERYYAVKYIGWKQNDRYPYVELVKEVGVVGNIEIECEMILNENTVYDNDFSDLCKEELKNFTHDSIVQEKQKRLDLTKEYICSIDPVTARDLDDALSIQKVEEGIYEVGVHIADVSHFVRANTEVDKEATLRTTSVYLVHKVIPMLPRMLCEELCSLNRDVERLAFSVFFKMTEEGDVLWNTFRASKSVIKSCAQLSYDIVNQMINGEIQQFSEGEARYAVAEGFDQNVLKEKILLLNQIAQKRRQKRLEGSLTFEKGKLRFLLDQSLKPIGFQEEKRGLAQFMVEEWMLLANQFVGKKLVEYDKKTAVLRQHMPPKTEKIAYYRQLLQAGGLEELAHNLDVSTSKKLKQTLDLINKLENEEIKAVLGFRLLRLMEAAMYFVVDESPEIDWRHYALDFDVYTHFTSPIRRYPDILAHRRLQIALENQEVDQSGETRDKLKAVLEKCNECKLNARRVSDSCDHLFLALYLKENPVIVDAYILNISQQYFEVIIPQYNLERKVDLKTYQSNYKIIIEDTNSKKYKIQEKKQQNQEVQQEEEKEKEKRINQIIIFYNDPNDEKGLRLYFIEQFQKIKIRLSGTETFPIEYKIQIIMNDDLLI